MTIYTLLTKCIVGDKAQCMVGLRDWQGNVERLQIFFPSPKQWCRVDHSPKDIFVHSKIQLNKNMKYE